MERLKPGAVSLAHGGLTRGPGRYGAAAGAQQQPGGQSLPAGHVPVKVVAAMFYTDDVQADYERMKARGAEFNATKGRDGLQNRHAERHLRQSHSDGHRCLYPSKAW